MVVYLVSKEQLNADRCGSYKDFYCYVMDFRLYRERDIDAPIFASAKQAINYMIRNAK